ncbi:MAG: alpha/beta hydrolase fold domain-containing protein, partial [Chloroflexota bacterium]
MPQTQTASAIRYIHDAPESLISRLLRFSLRFTRLKTIIERGVASDHINQQAPPLPSALTTRCDVTVTEHDGRSVWTLTPKASTSDQTVFFLHGGAYIFNLAVQHWQFITSLIKHTGVTVVVPDYPLAPSANAVDALAFTDAVYRQALSTTAPDKITFMGDSAGAGLAYAFAQGLRDAGAPLPRQLILFSPWLDITMTTPG